MLPKLQPESFLENKLKRQTKFKGKGWGEDMVNRKREKKKMGCE